ncbi:hypothetical protein DRE_01421 [Drechslerella stenobrocha 248]|uniref:RING-type domain-containing protein n=1 Tax=Drechslerella stenobrocha 248 TaxID=1043628 RepID=W7HKJ8_9PEZI|nr:hypothetical protein DRE_01421 [Drechslerella stenobrocha 248]
MSATSFNFSVIIIPSTLYSDPSNPGFQTLNKSLSFALEISSPQDFTTLHSQDSSRGSTYNGLLYVPDLDPDDPCDNPAIVPRNATRRENLPMDDLKLIAYAPLTTPHCCRQYMSSANNDYVSAFIFYGVASNYSNGTNPLRNEAFDVDYPVYYLDGSIGQPLMGKLSEYSGNMSELYNQASLEAAGYDLRDFARIYAVISTRGSNPMPGLWLFLLVVVAVLLFIIGASSLLMHLCQFHYRRSLRRRIANGEVDLEGLGIGRITVPREFLVKFPTYTYTAEESTAEGPRTPAVAAGPPRMEGSVEPKTPSKAAGSTNTSTSTNMNMNTSTSTSTNTNASASEAAGRAHLGRYSQTGCPICLEDFVREETRVRELPCGHVFHPECIDPYLETQSSLAAVATGAGAQSDVFVGGDGGATWVERAGDGGERGDAVSVAVEAIEAAGA